MAAHLNSCSQLRGAHLHQYNEAWKQYCNCSEYLASDGIFIRTTHTDLKKSIEYLLTFTKYSFRRNVVFYWCDKAHSARLKFFGPSKKEKESTKKLIKFYEDYFQDKKHLP
jgi:hypothetical protein